MKKLQQKKSPKFKLISRKGAYKIKGGSAPASNGNNGPYPPPYEPGGNNNDSKGNKVN